MKRSPKNIIPLPYAVYFGTVLVLAVAGLAVSGYLSYSHYLNYTDIEYQSFCAISTSINCDTVSQSPYSIIFNVPVPVWGVIGYVFFLGVVILGWRRKDAEAQIWAVIFWMALVFSIVSLGLAAISAFLIRSYCIMCIGIYLVSFFSLWFSWLIRRRFAAQGLFKDTVADLGLLWRRRRLLIPALSVFAAGTLTVIALMPPYWHMQPPRLVRQLPSGLTADGSPWIGASSHPRVEISVFSDYQCFQCKKMHMYLRQLLDRHPDKVRLVYRHYPMDHEVNPIVQGPFHRGSGKMALLAIYAASRHKFWQVSDILFQIAGQQKTIDLKVLAQRTGLDAVALFRALDDPVGRRRLNLDIQAGIKLGILGTPSFVVDGKVYPGVVPAEIIDRIIN